MKVICNSFANFDEWNSSTSLGISFATLLLALMNGIHLCTFFVFAMLSFSLMNGIQVCHSQYFRSIKF